MDLVADVGLPTPATSAVLADFAQAVSARLERPVEWFYRPLSAGRVDRQPHASIERGRAKSITAAWKPLMHPEVWPPAPEDLNTVLIEHMLATGLSAEELLPDLAPDRYRRSRQPDISLVPYQTSNPNRPEPLPPFVGAMATLRVPGQRKVLERLRHISRRRAIEHAESWSQRFNQPISVTWYPVSGYGQTITSKGTWRSRVEPLPRPAPLSR